MKLYSPKIINKIKDEHNFKLSKSLGQNFLIDKNIIEKIIDDADIDKDDLVIEIGPGIGVITREISQRAADVVAIEIDKNLIPILNETLKDLTNISILNQDILKTDLNQIIKKYKTENKGIKNVKIIGNLPYYITTPIVMKILEDGVDVKSITIMMQKEVADRIMAKPKEKARGALSVAVQYYCYVNKVVDVSKEVFIPQPKVNSTVLRLDKREDSPVNLKDDKLFFVAVKSGFGQRRKTILNSLSSNSGFTKEDIKEILETTGIDFARRAETLSMKEFASIANAMYDRRSK